MTPTFSPNKVRKMLPLIENCVHDLIEAFDEAGPIVDVKPYFSGFTLDTIANCAFGIQVSTSDVPEILSKLKRCFNVAKFGEKSEK